MVICTEGTDTMDVRFDSGDVDRSWQQRIADVYLEEATNIADRLCSKVIASGKDEIFEPQAPFRKVITHGTLDGRTINVQIKE